MEYVFIQCNFIGCRQCHWRANYTGPKSLLQQAVVCAEVFIQSVPSNAHIQWCESGYHSGTPQYQIKFSCMEILQYKWLNTWKVTHGSHWICACETEFYEDAYIENIKEILQKKRKYTKFNTRFWWDRNRKLYLC